MRNNSQHRLALAASITLLIIEVITFLIISSFWFDDFQWDLLLILAIVSFFFSYSIFLFVINRFIYDKIKVIYKTIRTIKLSKEEKHRQYDPNLDMLKKVNEDVKDWADARTQEIDNLKRLENYRREFLSNVSHELKTPLFNIQGYILTLADGAIFDPEVNTEYLKKTENNIERMINIVQDLEIIAQLEAGEIKLDFSTFDIIGLTREVFEMLETKAKKKNIQFIFRDDITETTHKYVRADKERIRQVLINLIDNSIKYGNDGGRTKISVYDLDEILLIEVSDNGIGIEPQHLSRLFERFYRVDKSRSRSQGGSGLGLAIVKHIIEKHDQSINVRSAPGIGSTFSFTLAKAK